MTVRNLTGHLERLEARNDHRVAAFAVQFAASDEVEVCGTGERMPRETFARRSLDGLIVLRLSEELWAAL
jgi:hypothetical protein